ncbi:MAG: hypothetical protein ACR2NP_08425, partial [Pirellulaceae bacterium]
MKTLATIAIAFAIAMFTNLSDVSAQQYSGYSQSWGSSWSSNWSSGPGGYHQSNNSNQWGQST